MSRRKTNKPVAGEMSNFTQINPNAAGIDIIKSSSTHILRMLQALTQMNLQLNKVISDITGVTGMAIIRAIVAGERNPQVVMSS